MKLAGIIRPQETRFAKLFNRVQQHPQDRNRRQVTHRQQANRNA